MYRGLLRREGEAEGVAQHAAFLRDAPGFANLSAALQGMVGSDEFRRATATEARASDIYEHVVRGVYRAVLERDADAGAIDNGIRHLRSAPGADSVAGFVETLFASDEFRARQASAMFDEVRRSTAAILPKIEAAPMPCVMSLGPACHVSTMLERWGLRNFSGPFDFMFSSARMIEAVLRDDFRTFLSKDQLEFIFVGHGEVRTDHKVYAGMAEYPEGHAGPLFLHHNLHHPTIYDHMVRSADRMRRALSTRSLMITIAQDRPGLAAEMQSLSDCIAELGPEVRLLDIVFGEPGGNLLPEINLLRQQGHHRFYELKPVSEIGETGFRALIDEIAVMRVVHQWSFDLQPL